MKKQIILTLTIILVIAFSLPVFAAPWEGMGKGFGHWGYNQELTDEQKAEIKQMNERLLQERKEMLDRRVEWGYISREDADKRIAFLEKRLNENPYRPMFGRRGHGGKGMGYGSWGYNKELTDEQKAEIKLRNERFFQERKEMLDRRVEWGYISRENADKHIAFLQERLEKDPYQPLHRRGGHGGHGRHGGGYGWGR